MMTTALMDRSFYSSVPPSNTMMYDRATGLSICLFVCLCVCLYLTTLSICPWVFP